ncbi:hypothetical protein, partial [Neisseria sp.]|uniref:hypothetical protein n=1 Tax=Neisseria sp. TaxID=192066 RepID=UPI0035A027AB
VASERRAYRIFRRWSAYEGRLKYFQTAFVLDAVRTIRRCIRQSGCAVAVIVALLSDSRQP